MTKLDDASAIQILKTIAQARLQAGASGLAPTPELRQALAASFGASPAYAVSEGDPAPRSTCWPRTPSSPSRSG